MRQPRFLRTTVTLNKEVKQLPPTFDEVEYTRILNSPKTRNTLEGTYGYMPSRDNWVARQNMRPLKFTRSTPQDVKNDVYS